MLVNALIISRDAALLGTLRRSAEELGIRPQVSPSAATVAALLTTNRFEGIFVDTDDVDGGEGLLAALRKIPSSRCSIIVGIVNGRTSPSDAFREGANMVLEKPVVQEKLLRSMRAAHSMMMRERRRAVRLPVDLQVFLRTGSAPEQRVNAVDLSEGGMAVESNAVLNKGENVHFRFDLPGGESTIEGVAQVVSATPDGRAGLCFIAMNGPLRSELTDWLAAQIERQANAALRIAPRPAAAERRAAAGA